MRRNGGSFKGFLSMTERGHHSKGTPTQQTGTARTRMAGAAKAGAHKPGDKEATGKKLEQAGHTKTGGKSHGRTKPENAPSKFTGIKNVKIFETLFNDLISVIKEVSLSGDYERRHCGEVVLRAMTEALARVDETDLRGLMNFGQTLEMAVERQLITRRHKLNHYDISQNGGGCAEIDEMDLE